MLVVLNIIDHLGEIIICSAFHISPCELISSPTAVPKIWPNSDAVIESLVAVLFAAGCPRIVHRHNDRDKESRSVWTSSKFWYVGPP